PLFKDGGAWFNEFAVKLPVAAEAVVNELAADGVLAGVALSEGALLLAATEKNRP
ncbi:unnamed protein product, partial [marine sediment metagenome]